MMRQIEGRCHCGNIQFKFLWPSLEAEIPVRVCGCSFCTRHNGTYTSHPNARLIVEIAVKSLVNKYVFGTKTAEFHICERCGVVPFVTSKIDGHEYGVVNVNTFENVRALQLRSSVSDFEGEALADRLQRRKRTWIPDITISIAREGRSD
ncbi:MAG: hypothetical protein V3T85_09670 [Acidiferrobacterales bacterium]